MLFCTAHRLNNILKHTFYQNFSKEKKNDKSKTTTTTTTVIERIEKTPNKTTKYRTTIEASPEVDSDAEMTDDENVYDTDESEIIDDDDDIIDYSATTISNLPTPAKEVLDTIRYCKALVKYTKKVINNAIIQLHRTVFKYTVVV